MVEYGHKIEEKVKAKKNDIKKNIQFYILQILKMAVRYVRAESTSPCTWVNHLADLLRNKANSQQHPSVYEDRRPKSIEDTEKTDGKGTASEQKGPWDQHDCTPQAQRICWACRRTPGREPS